MQKLIRNTHGISNVIGALMLTLVVVSAATSFALFVSQEQQQRQEAQLKQLQIELEDLSLSSLKDLQYNETTGNFTKVNITIKNMHNDPSTINMIFINDYYVDQFKVYRTNRIVENWKFNSSKGRYINQNKTGYHLFRLDSYETATIKIENNGSIRLPKQKNITKNTPITVKIYTSLTNEFEKTFYPPTAIIKIDIQSLPGVTDDYYILDGSQSDHPGDGYIIKWDWNVTNISHTPDIYNETGGRKAQTPDPLFITVGYTYRVNLTVTDNYGMKATTSFEFKT